ncbi:MAG: hypothetical protein WC387_03885, partial [Candidatus Paceibacterota bacterium]
WGVKWDPQLPYNGYKTCPRCDCHLLEKARSDGLSWCHYLVGFSSVIPRSSTRKDIIGIMMLNCPLCWSTFWQHANKLNCALAKEDCPNWPRDENGRPL